MQGAIESGFHPLLEFDMDAMDFDGHWEYCDIMSTFVSRMVSHNRSDPFKYSNLLSATLNELFETVYRTRKDSGLFRFRILRRDATDRITITVPCGDDEQKFLAKAAEDVRAPDALKKYFGILFAEEELDRRVGLYELAISYSARISVDILDDNLIRLMVDLILEDRVD